MPEIALPTGLRGDSLTPKQQQTLINCYYEVGERGAIVPRPGVELYLEAYGRCRGQGRFKDEAYFVQSDQLVKITDNANNIFSTRILLLKIYKLLVIK